MPRYSIFLVASVLSCLAAAILILYPPSDLEDSFATSTYYSLWATLALLSIVGARGLAAHPLRLAALCWPAAFALALTMVLLGAVPRAFRVLSDETNLIGTSLGFYLERSAVNVTQGLAHSDSFHVLGREVPGRPSLFPFAMYLLHSLRGYSAYHGFLVNAGACFATLATFVGLGYRLGAPALGFFAATLTAAFPLFALSVTASGYDALNLCLLVVTLLLLFEFLSTPTSGRLELLGLVAALAMQCRHETILIFVPIVLSAWLSASALKTQRPPLLLAALPLLAVPMVWQRELVSAANGTAPVAQLFGAQFVLPHLRSAWSLFWQSLPAYPTSRPIFILGLCGAAAICLRLARKPDARAARRFAALAALTVALLAVAQCAFYMGDLRPAFQNRLGLIYLMVLPLCAAYPLLLLWRRLLLRGPTLVLLGILLTEGLAVAARDEHGKTLPLRLEYQRALAFLESLPTKSVLVVAERPGLYAAHRRGAVTFAAANAHAGAIGRGYQQGLYEDIIVIQRVPSSGGEPRPALSLPLSFATVVEFPIPGASVVRISRVK